MRLLARDLESRALETSKQARETSPARRHVTQLPVNRQPEQQPHAQSQPRGGTDGGVQTCARRGANWLGGADGAWPIACRNGLPNVSGGGLGSLGGGAAAAPGGLLRSARPREQENARLLLNRPGCERCRGGRQRLTDHSLPLHAKRNSKPACTQRRLQPRDEPHLEPTRPRGATQNGPCEAMRSKGSRTGAHRGQLGSPSGCPTGWPRAAATSDASGAAGSPAPQTTPGRASRAPGPRHRPAPFGRASGRRGE